MYIKVGSAKCQTKGAESSVNESRALMPVILFLEFRGMCCFGQWWWLSCGHMVLNALEMRVTCDGDWTQIPAEYLYIAPGNSFISIVNTFLTSGLVWQLFPEYKPLWVALAETLHRCREAVWRIKSDWPLTKFFLAFVDVLPFNYFLHSLSICRLLTELPALLLESSVVR